MQRQMIAALALLALAGSAATEAVSGEDVVSEVIAVERERLRAFAAADYATFDRLTDDTLTMVHSNGERMNKAQERSIMRPSTPERPLPALSLDAPQVRVHGDAAVITGDLVESSAGVVRLRLRFSNTYFRQDGHWRLAAGQLTRVPT